MELLHAKADTRNKFQRNLLYGITTILFQLKNQWPKMVAKEIITADVLKTLGRNVLKYKYDYKAANLEK